MADPRGRSALIAAGALLALPLAILPAAPASAHVSVDPASSPERAGWGQVTFTVPTESQEASTSRLDLTFLDDVDFTVLRTKPVPGWSAEVLRDADDRISGLVWEAEEDARIAPGEFQSFTIFAGPWPDAESAAVPVVQHYSDGSAVEWSERSLDDAIEPDYPAPVVPLIAGDASDEHGGVSAPVETPEARDSEGVSHADDALGRGLAIAGLVVGTVALSGVVVLLRRR